MNFIPRWRAVSSDGKGREHDFHHNVGVRTRSSDCLAYFIVARHIGAYRSIPNVRGDDRRREVENHRAHRHAWYRQSAYRLYG